LQQLATVGSWQNLVDNLAYDLRSHMALAPPKCFQYLVTLFLTQNAVTDVQPEFLEDIKHAIKSNLG